LVGQWTLVSVEVVRNEKIEHPLGRDVSGVLLYGESGAMAVQIMQANRPRFASDDQADGTLAELAAAVGGYVAYFGHYSVDERARTVTHHVAGSLFPNSIGTDQRRDIVLEGGKLTLSAPPALYKGKQQVFRVVWTKAQ
jgi:hypothetical protein